MSRSQGTLLIVLVIALLGVIAISVLHRDEDEGSPATTVTATEPEIVTRSQLADFAAESGKPVYWIGPRRGATYELTGGAGEPVYVRYLRDGAPAGDPRPDFVTVATYPGENGVVELREAAADRSEAKLSRNSDGALVLSDPSLPESVYLAYPDTNVQVELFSPIPGHARRLASKGEVLRVR